MKWWHLVLLALATTLCFTRLALLVFLAILIFAAFHRKSSLDNALRRLIWLYLISTGFVIVLYQLAWLVGAKLSTSVALSAFIISVWLYVFNRTASVTGEREIINERYWLGAAAALGICVYVCLPIILNPSATQVLRYAGKTGDDINHIALVEADRKAESYLYSPSSNNISLVDSKLIGYPQGWHINGAFLESLTVKFIGSDSVSARLISYLIYKTIWLFLATYFLYELLMHIFGTFTGQASRQISYIAAISAFWLSLIILVTLFGYGFQNFIADIAIVCAAFVLMCVYLKSVSRQQKIWLLVTLSMLTVAATCIWVLPGAVIGLLTALIAIREIKLWYGSWMIWLSLAFGAALSLSQIYMTQRVNTQSSISSLNLGGATPPISIVGLVALLLATGLLIYKTKLRFKKWLYLLTGLSGFEFLLLAVYQQVQLGEQRYYVIKLAFLTAAVVSLTLIAILWESTNNKLGRQLLCIITLVLIPLLLGLSPKKSAYPLKDSAPIQESSAAYILKLPANNPEIVIQTSNKEENYLANKLWSSVHAYNSANRQRLLKQLNLNVGQ